MSAAPILQLRPISTSHYYISGDVTIQAGAAIAPGVLIQADPDCQIIIKSGACIGVGAILHAHNGTVEVGEGANIGAEVLLVGQVSIGANACVGAGTTVYNGIVSWGQVIPPGSLIGDTSRQSEELKVTDTTVIETAETPTAADTVMPTVVELPGEALAVTAEGSQRSGINVYGQMYVNNLMLKLFPHQQVTNQQVNPAPPEKPSLSEDPWDD
jgi:carbon dioxide concentrating mechanism protein CcmN